jgi:opacity protein-like surface antigen
VFNGCVIPMKKILLASALLVSSLYAHADGSPRIFAEFGLSFVNYEENDSGDVFTSNPHVFRLIGGAQLGENLDVEVMLGVGAEGDLVKFDGVTYSDFNLKIDSMYGFFFKPKFEISPMLDVFCRLGYVNASATASVDGYGSATSKDAGLAYGAGVSLKFDSRISFNIDYMSYLKKPTFTAKGVTFALGYKF